MTTSWSRIALLYAIGVIASGQLGLLPPLVPLLQAELGLSLSGAGMAVSIVTLAAALLGLVAGLACERIGHARAVHIGLLVMAAAAGLCAVADGAISLLAARAAAGFGYLLAVVAAPSLMVTVAAPRHHAVALSLWGTFVPTGIALSEIAASNFAQGFAWRTLFGLDAILLTAMLGMALIGLRSADHRPAPAQPAGGRRGLMEAAPLALAFFCFALLFLALTGMLPAYLVGQRGLDAGDAGRLVAVTTALGIPGSLAAAELMRRGVAPSRLIAFGLAASMAVAALSFAGLPLPVALAGFALSFAIGGLVPAATFASVPRIAPDSQAIGPINGLLAQTGSLGSLAGPPLLALSVEHLGWSAAAVLLIVLAAVGAASALVARQA